MNLVGSSYPGSDGICPMALKSCMDEIALPLTLIVQKSLISGWLPFEWRSSRVIPIFKGGSKASPLNYRPVSVTFVCCRVMEGLLAGHGTQ